MRSCDYSLAFDSTTTKDDSYLDIRIPIHMKTQLHNIHLSAIPVRSSHTELAIFHLVSDTLEAFAGTKWNEEQLVVTIDGASKMTGRFQGALTRLEECELSGFIRFWFVAQKMYFLIQVLMTSLINGQFQNLLFNLFHFFAGKQTPFGNEI